MAFSFTATHIVFGVTLLLIVEIVIGGFLPTFLDIKDSHEDMVRRSTDQIKTDIEIINITSNPVEGSCNVTVKNTGSTILETDNFDILIDGVLTDFTCQNSFIDSNNVTVFLIGASIVDGAMIKVITSNGISDYIIYNE